MRTLLATVVLATTALATSADAALTLNAFGISGNSFQLAMSGTITTPYNIQCDQIRITSTQAGPWGDDRWFLSNLASMTIGSATANRIDMQSFSNGSQIVVFFDQTFTTGDLVSGSVDVILNNNGFFANLDGRTFDISATPSSGWNGGQYLFSGLPASGVPAPGAAALLGLAGVVGGRRRR